MNKKICILGSLNMDLVMNTPYMPKEGETMTGSGFFSNCGGKGGNQAVASARIGGDVYFIGGVGNDIFGKQLLSTINSYGINSEFVKCYDCSSGIAVILVCNGNNRIILEQGANAKVTTELVDKALENFTVGDIFIAQFELPYEIVKYAIAKAKAMGMFTILNPAPAVTVDKDLLANVDLFAPNETELEITTKYSVTGLDDIKQAMRQLNMNCVLTTLGSNGSILLCGDSFVKFDAVKVKAIDTTAAGDTFIGSIATKLSKGESLNDSIKFATYASALTVTKKGAMQSIPSENEVIDFINGKK